MKHVSSYQMKSCLPQNIIAVVNKKNSEHEKDKMSTSSTSN
jgi:hypothetical protein